MHKVVFCNFTHPKEENLMTQEQLKSLQTRRDELKSYLKIDEKSALIEDKEAITQQPDFWDHPEEAQKVLREIRDLKVWTDAFRGVEEKVGEVEVLFDFFKEGELDEAEMSTVFDAAVEEVEELEFKNMLSGEEDKLGCILDINAGAGGTESQDWANMLKRMYSMYADKHEFKWSIIGEVEGDTAGIKSCSIEVNGDFAYGYLKGESGVHRLVRISPFDSNNRRHTSFASVFVYPQIDDSIEIEVNQAEVKFDTFHSSGKGGQNVNKVETAVRLTHIPTGIVVECQQERSQLRNRDKAMQMLKSRLYQVELEKQEEERAKVEGSKKKIEWGSQIRNYVMHPYKLVKDVRTNTETSNVQAVMDGELDAFIKSFLMSQGAVSK